MSQELATTPPDFAEFELATTSGSLMLAGGPAFAHIQRVAKMFSSSQLVPEAFQNNVPNCVIALEMAHRMGANPMAVAQNLYIVHGRPGWSSQFIIACVNQCGKFSPLRFELTGTGDERSCVAWAIEKETGDRLEGPPVSIKMAKDEGWHGKNGSKWKTMPELMLRYRAATFFGRLYAPDLLMGMQTAEEAADIVERPVRGQEVKTGLSAMLAAPTQLPPPPAKGDSFHGTADDIIPASACIKEWLESIDCGEQEYCDAIRKLKLTDGFQWKYISEGEHQTALDRREEVEQFIMEARA